jgi:DNA-binding transcriptional MerR regulator
MPLTLDITPGFILYIYGGVGTHWKSGRAGRSQRGYNPLLSKTWTSRSVGGYRLFEEEQIHELKFVRHAQDLGFSLTEVKELLALRQKHHACSEVQTMLTRKLADVREKVKGLARLEAELRGALSNCNRELRLKREIKHDDCCPLLTKLDRMNGSNNQYVSTDRKSRNK